MAEGRIRHGKKDIITPSPIDIIRKLGYPSLQELLAWYPTTERIAEIKQAPQEEQAAFAAQMLGNINHWEDALEGLQIYRPHIGGATADDLRIPPWDITRVYEATQTARRHINGFIDRFIADELGGDYTVVAMKAANAGQVSGLLLSLRRNLQQDEPIEMAVSFADGTKSISDGIEGLLYFLDEVKGSTPVQSASYDKETRTISVTLPHRQTTNIA